MTMSCVLTNYAHVQLWRSFYMAAVIVVCTHKTISLLEACRSERNLIRWTRLRQLPVLVIGGKLTEFGYIWCQTLLTRRPTLQTRGHFHHR